MARRSSITPLPCGERASSADWPTRRAQRQRSDGEGERPLRIRRSPSPYPLPLGERVHAARTRTLEAKGFRVLRFSNREVMTSIDVVLDTILAALGMSPPTPDPSPRGGGERAS
ncbi:MAG TPA: DUF559 domain-containing protein [Beijerinckiaceae bacterium]|nr:DUF559 domain-containing protein [Beijerinckiaceae bacterium]